MSSLNQSLKEQGLLCLLFLIPVWMSKYMLIMGHGIGVAWKSRIKMVFDKIGFSLRH